MRALPWLLLVACSFEHGDLPGATIDSTIDAADVEIDAPLACPASYTLTLTSTTSRYRAITTVGAFAKHHTECNADLVGATHLASLETAGEATELAAALLGVAAGQYYVGVVQKPNSSTTTADWWAFTGTALPDGLFGNSNDDSPGENNEENLGGLNTTDLLHDVTGDVAYPAVCECDGHSIDPTVATYIP